MGIPRLCWKAQDALEKVPLQNAAVDDYFERMYRNAG